MRARWPAFSSPRTLTVSTPDAGQRPSSHFVRESSILSELLNVRPGSAAINDAGVFKLGCRLRLRDEGCKVEGEGGQERFDVSSSRRTVFQSTCGARASSGAPIVIQFLNRRFLGGSLVPPEIQSSTDICLLLHFPFNCVISNTSLKAAPFGIN
jgi:hypothetical protein